jgi:predicted amidohydrolase YtcJ
MTAAPHTQLLPGFVEHHCHFRAWAAHQHQLDVSGATDIDVVLAAIHHRSDAIIRGFGLPAELLIGCDELASRLDEAADGRPVLLMSRDQHALATTPATLTSLGIALDALAVPGGIVERYHRGTWNGVLREESAWIVRRAIGTGLTLDQHRAALALATRRGITSIHDMDGLDALRDWTALHDRDGQLDVRATVHLLAGDLDHVDEARSLQRPGSVRVGGLKLFADGTLGSGTALLDEPEHPQSGHEPRRGVEIVAPADIQMYARRAAALDLPLLVHAIGDRAVTNVVDALEATRDAWRALDTAPRIEHAQLMRDEDMRRCAQLGITLSVQPTMLTTDRDEADARWGTERTRRAFAYCAMHDAGCRLVFGSDAPIEPMEPLASIHAALHRDGGAHGLPPARGAWHPQQRLDLETAIGAATGWAPRQVAADQDAVLLTGDSPAEWQVAGTRLGARWTWRAVD